jgi:hypothetical protein
MLIILDWSYTGDRNSGDLANPRHVPVPTEMSISINSGVFEPVDLSLSPGPSQRYMHRERYGAFPSESLTSLRESSGYEVTSVVDFDAWQQDPEFPTMNTDSVQPISPHTPGPRETDGGI